MKSDNAKRARCLGAARTLEILHAKLGPENDRVSEPVLRCLQDEHFRRWVDTWVRPALEELARYENGDADWREVEWIESLVS
jgi:hypothetical protein